MITVNLIKIKPGQCFSKNFISPGTNVLYLFIKPEGKGAVWLIMPVSANNK